MQIIGVKISHERIAMGTNDPDARYEGYWCYRTREQSILIKTRIFRKSVYDAEHDAILSAKQYSKDNTITFISEGYIL